MAGNFYTNPSHSPPLSLSPSPSRLCMCESSLSTNSSRETVSKSGEKQKQIYICRYILSIYFGIKNIENN